MALGSLISKARTIYFIYKTILLLNHLELSLSLWGCHHRYHCNTVRCALF